MLKTCRSALFIFIFWLGSLAPSHAVEAPGAPALWKAEIGKATVYLFGTIHMQKKADMWRPADLPEAVQRADVLFLESDVNDKQVEIEVASFLAENGAYPSGESLKDHFSSEEIAQILQQTNNIGLPETVALTMRPWFLSISLALYSFFSQGFDPELGADSLLDEQFRDADKPVLALEASLAPLEIMAAFPATEEKAMLLQSIEQIAIADTYVAALYANWQIGDLDALNTLLRDPRLVSPEVSKVLIEDRNRTWMAKILPLGDKEQTVLIAAGAAHFVGDGNLIELISAAGHKVTEINYASRDRSSVAE
ncbi:MAG: TraB/GumN family protein [Pseudomonadota bacterium]